MSYCSELPPIVTEADFDLLKLHGISHLNMLLSHNALHIFLLVSVCLSMFIYLFIEPERRCTFQKIGLIISLMPLLTMYFDFICKMLFDGETFIPLFSTGAFHQIFKRSLLLNALTLAIFFPVLLAAFTKNSPRSVFEYTLRLFGINLFKAWLYANELPIASGPLGWISFATWHCPITSIALIISGFVFLICFLNNKKKHEIP